MTNALSYISSESLPSIYTLNTLIESISPQSDGRNRDRHRTCQIQATNDYEAFMQWLDRYKFSRTHQSYRREIERFFLWSLFQHKKTLSDFTVEDFYAYQEFLGNPQPAHYWCGRPNANSRYGEEGWKPFTGSLGERAIRYSFTVIKSMLNYWVEVAYWSSHPLSTMRILKDKNLSYSHALHVQARILEPIEWEAMQQTLASLPENNLMEQMDKKRLNLIVMLLFFLGLRVNELVTHTWSAFRETQGKWWFYSLGKGNKLAKIPVHETLLEAIKEYRSLLRKEPYPLSDDLTPIILSWKTLNPLTTRHINRLLKDLAHQTINFHFKDQPFRAAKLKGFSPHWLRHLSASMQDRAGVSLTHIKENLRHSKVDTTRIYIHADDEKRHEAIQQLEW